LSQQHADAIGGTRLRRGYGAASEEQRFAVR
jgi:hypothetical protein